MKVEKINSISSATVSAGLLLATLASTSAEATSTNSSKATWRKFNAEAPRNIENQFINRSNETATREKLEEITNKVLKDLDGEGHPVFKPENEIQEILKNLEGISGKNPTTSSEIFNLIEGYRLRRDLHLRLGNLGEAMCDEQKLVHFERLFWQVSAKEMRDIMGDKWIDCPQDPKIAQWTEGHSKFREGLSQLVFATPPYPFIPGEKEKGIAALTEAAQAGIPEALLILKALDLPLPQSSNTDEWLVKALSNDFEGALKDLEALYAEDSLEYDVLTRTALVHLLNGDKSQASACLWKVRSAWEQNYGIIMPELALILSSGMQAAEIQKLFHL